MESNRKLPESEAYEGREKRTDNDLDSFVFGTPSSGQVKVYLNTREDSEEDLLPRIDLILAGLMYAKSKVK